MPFTPAVPNTETTTDTGSLYIQRLKQLLLVHPDSGKLSCYVISNGAMYPELSEAFMRLHELALTEL